jgi:hypothetical protein
MQRGVACAASYEARKFGVRSAMPSATAGRLCPSGVFVRPRMDHYREESRAIMQLVAATGATIEPMWRGRKTGRTRSDEASKRLNARARNSVIVAGTGGFGRSSTLGDGAIPALKKHHGNQSGKTGLT